MVKIFNLDWLQFSGFCDPLYLVGINKLENYSVTCCDYGTKHFKTILEVFDHRQNKKVATIALNPHSKAIAKNLCLYKVENWLLYQNYLKPHLTEMLRLLQIDFNNLSRVDVCCDFLHLDYRKILPSQFIKSFLAEKYIKLRRSKGQVFFEQGESLDFQYIKFGSGKSRVCSYLYNKTKELEQVKNKPHITETWKKNGLEGIIWRCEFRIQNFDFVLTDKETGEQINYNGNLVGLKSLDIIDNHKDLFLALSNHYLRFKVKGNDTNKSRLKDFKLFNEPEDILFSKVYNDNPESSRSDKIFIKKLYEINNSLRGTDYDLGINGDEVLSKFINATELHNWAKNKNIEITNPITIL
jgi:hypothetical protein